MVWKPDVTVAVIVQREDRFLLIEEHIRDQLVINQPAGHLEVNETLPQAAIRETLEETAWDFVPDALTGIYLWPHPDRHMTFLRVAFTGRLTEHHSQRRLDHGIRRTLWWTRDEVARNAARLRSPMVLQCIDDYLRGARYPLSLLTHLMEAVSADSSKSA
jgi:8-oxo-dGTP pyrophosphatase MutT (NUDIX family)